MKKAEIHNLKAMDYTGTEALNTICSNLSFAGKNLKKIVFTSCSASDGKSFMTIQIAMNLAKRGRRVGATARWRKRCMKPISPTPT